MADLRVLCPECHKALHDPGVASHVKTTVVVLKPKRRAPRKKGTKPTPGQFATVYADRKAKKAAILARNAELAKDYE